jgi:quinol-cytochrome oxidoreductase complex cytochrome b subunit
MTTQRRTIAPDIGLLFVLTLATDAVISILAGGVSARTLMWDFYLIAFVHIGASLYGGLFDRARSATWLLLILGWAAGECLSFANYVMPMGQFLFWLAANAPWAVPIIERLAATPSMLPAVLLLLLAVDVFFAQRNRWSERRWWWLAILIVTAVAIGLALHTLLGEILPAPAPLSPLSFDILPSWHLLPFYSLLRAMPDKSLGVALAFLALIVPAFWPWLRPRAAAGTAHLVWRAAWLAFVAAFIGLGYLGAQPPAEGVVLATRILTVYYFAFLLVIPLLLRRVKHLTPSRSA